MGAPKTVVYCGKCGNNLISGERDIKFPIETNPCRICLRAATLEGFVAGRANAMAELFIEEKK